MEEQNYIINLEKHETKDVKNQHINGNLVVVYRDYDKILKNEPKMVYVSSVNPGEVKGPHLHKKRNSYFLCVHGKVRFVIKEDSGKYIEIDCSAEKPQFVFVPKNIPSAHINLSGGISRILTLADVSWKPNDNEMENVIFENYKFENY